MADYKEGVDYVVVDKGGYKTRRFLSRAEKAQKNTAPAKAAPPAKAAAAKPSKPAVAKGGIASSPRPKANPTNQSTASSPRPKANPALAARPAVSNTPPTVNSTAPKMPNPPMQGGSLKTSTPSIGSSPRPKANPALAAKPMPARPISKTPGARPAGEGKKLTPESMAYLARNTKGTK